MAAPKPKNIVTLKVESTCPSHARTDVVVRDTETTIDEPVARGGTNLGPTPTEMLLAALAGCTNVIANKVAHQHGVELSQVSVDVTSDFDRRGVILAEEIDLPFDNIEVLINVTTDADDATLEKVKADLPKFCPVSKVFRQAGATVTDIWTVNRP